MTEKVNARIPAIKESISATNPRIKGNFRIDFDDHVLSLTRVTSMRADGLIGLKRNMGCKQRPAVVAGGKAERKLCFLRNVRSEAGYFYH